MGRAAPTPRRSVAAVAPLPFESVPARIIFDAILPIFAAGEVASTGRFVPQRWPRPRAGQPDGGHRGVVSGLDRNRLALVLAILGRHGGIGVGGCDVFVNVVGGVRVDEPGVDLAIALAVASAAKGVALNGRHPGQPADTANGVVPGGSPCACFGELGLTGELRWVGHPERRLAQAARHGGQAFCGRRRGAARRPSRLPPCGKLSRSRFQQVEPVQLRLPHR